MPTKRYRAHGPGISYGLEVILNNDLDDYFYTATETTGFKVQISHSRDYPDVLSGALKEILIGPGEQALFSLDFDVIQSVSQVKSIPIHLRKCLFESEAHTSFGPYTQSDCFVECKLKSMQALCNCSPFVMPFESNNSLKYHSICSLIDIPCLNQYLRKWTKYFPRDTEIDDLEMEQQDSLNCNCLPSCDEVNYNVYTNIFPIENADRNITKINVFFIKGYGSLYKIDMTHTWFEVISSYGGLMSLIMGLSLISMIEVFVLFYNIILHYVRNILWSK